MADLAAMDRIVRAVLGAAIVGYSLPRGIDDAAWHMIGIAGAFLLLTAVVRGDFLHRIPALPNTPHPN